MNLKDKTKKLCQSVLFFYEDKILVKNNFLKNLDVTIKKLKKFFSFLRQTRFKKYTKSSRKGHSQPMYVHTYWIPFVNTLVSNETLGSF